jgi:hypothetical protein
MDTEQKELDPSVKSFFEAIDTALPAYGYAAISFVSIVHEGYETILRASLRLSMEPLKAGAPERLIFGLRAAQLPFPIGSWTIRELILAVLSGQAIPVGDHLLRLMPDSARGYLIHHENSTQFQRRANEYGNRLTVGGINPWPLVTPRQQELDRALQAQAFDSLADLLLEYGHEPFGHLDESTFEVIAGPVARIESTSATRGSATVSVLLASGLRPEAFQLVVRNANRNEESKRRTIDAHEFQWTDLADHVRGRLTFEIRSETAVECRALYAGNVQDLKQFADPASMPNRRRTIVELNDPGLLKLTEVLTGIRERDDKLRNEFGASVAVLFYLLGFETVRIGGNRRSTDGPDIYALTTSDELLVIEATSGAFSDEKCAKLLTRVKSAREALSQARPGPARDPVVGIVVTPRRRDELVRQLASAEKQGVLVLCHPEIVDAIERTQLTPNAEDVLRRWRERPLLSVLTRGFDLSRG